MKKILPYPILAASLALLSDCGGGGGGSGGGGPATQLSVSGPPISGAGLVFPVTVTALDAANNVATGYSGTVHFTSSDPAAVLPSDATLVNGVRTVSVTLTDAGDQTITAIDAASLKGSLQVTAIADAFPVAAFGAKGDGQTDDTAAIQTAINAASAAGGGSVVFSVARYFTAGALVVPSGVVLSGTVEGPFDVGGPSPAVAALAPTLLVTNTSGPFLTLNGVGAGITDLLFHYPTQVNASAAAPKVFPYTILVTAPGTKVVRSTVTNAYNFLDIEVGRSMARDLFIGAFNVGINIDHARDHVTLRHLVQTVFWDIVENAPFPSPIDTWVMSHGTALVVGRVDSLEMSDFMVFQRYTGMLLTDSPDASQGTRCGYGTGSGLDVEGVVYAIVLTASNTPGYKFTGLFLQSPLGGGQAAVQVRAGGSMKPKILINGGSQGGGPWASGGYPPPGPDAIVDNMLP
ncbi:MAG TPA: glycosyl hydrolase family 28-related protein [Steroidobacteraceae bacterium]|jgi:hypothetical protein